MKDGTSGYWQDVQESCTSCQYIFFCVEYCCLYGYAGNNPVKYTDPDGCIPVDTVWDIVFTLFDAGVATYKSINGDNSGWTDVALDAASIFVPYVPAGISKVKNATHILNNINKVQNVAGAVKSSVWSLPAFKRGWEIERKLGGMMNNFPVIDYAEGFIEDFSKYIGSIKSMDLNAKTYQNARNVYNKISSYVNKLANFKTTEYAGRLITVESVTVRILDLAIPLNATPEQLKAIYDASAEAAKKGINIVVHIID